MQTILLAVVFFVAAGFQTVTGFGFGLLCAATLFVFFDPKLIVVLVAMPALLATYTSLAQSWKSVAWRRLAPFAGWMLVGLPVGVLGLEYLPTRGLKGLMALMLLYALFHRGCLRSLWVLQWTPLSGTIAGIGSGALGTSGPAVVSWVHSKDWPHQEKVAATLAAFALVNSVRIPVYFACGMFDPPRRILMALALFPVVMAGSFAGGWVGRRITDETGRKIARAAIVVLTLVTLKGALFP